MDRRDLAPAAGDEMGDGGPGSLAVLDVDVAEGWAVPGGVLARRPAVDDDRDAAGDEAAGHLVVAARTDDHGAVDVTGGDVALETLLLAGRLGDEQDELHLVVG